MHIDFRDFMGTEIEPMKRAKVDGIAGQGSQGFPRSNNEKLLKNQNNEDFY